MRHNGHGPLTFEDARTWIEETGLCLFLPKRQFSSSIAPSFVEAVAGQRNATPDPQHIVLAEELLVRLETADVAVRLNLQGQPGEQPDFVVASWVLPYVYALRGDRDWRRSPQLTGSRQVSQLAVQAYKLLEAGDATIATLKHTLGREVTEAAVLRAITELWQQLRIIPVISAPGEAAKWQLLRHRYQKAIAEGASTSQVTAISVLASIYLQAVIAASMEEVELFLAPLTARSKVREVLRGLVATRQIHTLSVGHAPHFYVAGTLPAFTVAPTLYASSSMSASSYFMHAREHEEDLAHHETHKAQPAPYTPAPESHRVVDEFHSRPSHAEHTR
jgi:23S rRNA pseudouridine2605 synthase